MSHVPPFASVALVIALLSAPVCAQGSLPLRLVSDPDVSPDGSTIVFAWAGDLWTAPTAGGAARPLTTEDSREREPHFSPDGRRIAFTSDREGSFQIYVMDAAGGAPEQMTFHSAGYSLQDWFPDSASLLAVSSRDNYWDDARRFFRVRFAEPADAEGVRPPRKADELLFDDYGDDGRISPDGTQLLFVREGPSWWRKGYHGSQAAQIWSFDLVSKAFREVLHTERGARSPRWTPDGLGFYYAGEQSGNFNLYAYRFASSESTPITRFEEDAVVLPALSRDGRTLVFRNLFDLYRMDPASPDHATRIALSAAVAHTPPRSVRRTLEEATDVAYSADGLEIAFIAGGDVYVMDTELREPVAVTSTPEEERTPAFSPDGEVLVFASDRLGQSDVWSARRADGQKYWWQNGRFELARLTNDGEVERALSFRPDGQRLAYVRGLGDLWTMKLDGTEAARVITGRDSPQYVWSPDGKWFALAHDDDDFNSDIWIVPSDGSGEPFNLSKHPDNESGPSWSPDGKVLAFTGRRNEDEVDVYFVYLAKQDDDLSKRDRTLAKAIEKMDKERKKQDAKKDKGGEPKSDEPKTGESAAKSETNEAAAGEKDDSKDDQEQKKPDEKKPKVVPEVVIDREDIHQRVRRISIPDSRESSLVWAHDSKKLAFSATVDGKRGTYTVEIPDELEPKRLTEKMGSDARWIERGNQIVWLSGGVPASVSDSGKETVWKFTARQEFERAARHRAGFDLAWRTMRDQFYDGTLNHRNWDAIREKYAGMAADTPDAQSLATVVQLMLGEINGSHLGFTPRSASGRDADSPWRIETAHLGLRFDASWGGPGWKVRDVIPKGPADRAASRVLAGELVLSIDGRAVEPQLDPTEVLNGPLERAIDLEVQDSAGAKRTVSLRPISQGAARSLLYNYWLATNRKRVEELSGGALGYMHVSAMSWPSFLKFEEELYAVGAGKQGLVIDVRENGGGSTADHLLTALTQPVHAITVPRGGGPGYPQDRKVYASWTKPIVVLCNQNSFSNAEIFSHAIKTLKRGRLVGTPTAGGVISTGSAQILDLGTLRLPFRGWFVLDTGEDMERNGAVPDVVIWPQPGELPVGVDRQLERAVELLQEDVRAWLARPAPKLRKASER